MRLVMRTGSQFTWFQVETHKLEHTYIANIILTVFFFFPVKNSNSSPLNYSFAMKYCAGMASILLLQFESSRVPCMSQEKFKKYSSTLFIFLCLQHFPCLSSAMLQYRSNEFGLASAPLFLMCSPASIRLTATSTFFPLAV